MNSEQVNEVDLEDAMPAVNGVESAEDCSGGCDGCCSGSCGTSDSCAVVPQA